MAGERGIAVLVDHRIRDEPTFTLQFRAIEANAAPLPPLPITITVETRVCIKFCPWCGANLTQKYGARVDEMERDQSTSLNPANGRKA
jgi:hypothetical protein